MRTVFSELRSRHDDRQATAQPGLITWLQGRAPVPLVVGAVLLLLNAYYQAYHAGNNGLDNTWVTDAARLFVDGKAPYANERFLYLPAGVLVGVPQTRLGHETLLAVVPLAGIVLVLGGWFFALRLFAVPVLSRLAVLVAGGLAMFEPFTNVVQIGNWTSGYVLVLPLALLLARREQWIAAAVVLGLAISIKPILAPVVLLFLMARRFLAFLTVLALPLVISVAAGAMMPQASLFVTKTLPYLLKGQGDFATPFDASIGNVLTRLGLPESAASVLGLAVGAATVLLAWRRWRNGGDQALRLAETSAMLMLAAFLASKPSFDHYMLIPLVPVVAGVLVPGAAARSPWFWLGLIPMVNGLNLPYVSAWNTYNYRVTFTNSMTAAVLAVRSLFPARAGYDARQQPAAAGPAVAAEEAPGLLSPR
ncbi:glycosyltransferase family 87 protein [Kitasatospora sp. NPDC088134]|uniref:glycosyltransferase family 87 protein n=1 Tax=Kitasatospora sp. NPDC088134 TaxID=3364071 RepID=UPI0038164897